jgi:hypothetical protein
MRQEEYFNYLIIITVFLFLKALIFYITMLKEHHHVALPHPATDSDELRSE